MTTLDPRPARDAVARLVREIDEAMEHRRADDDEFQEAAAQARDLVANSASMLETLQHIEELTVRFMADPQSEPHPAQLLIDIFVVARIALDPIEGVIEQ
ncbi:hypothetical protein [Phenylobacterium sp.]|uniref:hypothetical protein n=1 Tax=Phenylobacterium sp. TaxID=1871053 RepID=UPI0035C7E994